MEIRGILSGSGSGRLYSHIISTEGDSGWRSYASTRTYSKGKAGGKKTSCRIYLYVRTGGYGALHRVVQVTGQSGNYGVYTVDADGIEGWGIIYAKRIR